MATAAWRKIWKLKTLRPVAYTLRKRKTRWSSQANQHLEPVQLPARVRTQATTLVPHTLKPHGLGTCYREVRLTITGYSKVELWHQPIMIVISFCTIQGLNKNNGWTCRSYSSSQEISTNIFFTKCSPIEVRPRESNGNLFYLGVVT